ncbi:MAG: transporter substrate-binding domain-containing protein [Bacteroidales bacterium]|nr:transporter substrate-binding domain-containing protein [Bacteroidales bacterium]
MTEKRSHRAVILLLLAPLVLSLGSCKGGRGSRFQDVEQLRPEDRLSHLEEIRQYGALKVVTEYNSISYFLYRGQPMGFQFELLQDLANNLNLALEVSVSNDLDKNFADLREGTVDLIAMNLTVTSERKTDVAFTAPLLQTRQVLVQRKPEHWQKMNRVQLDSELVRNQLDLGGKVVYVQKGSVYEARLSSLSDEIGGGIRIEEVNMESEQLIHRVALGEIDYAVCDENVGLVNTTYFPELDVGTAISFPQHVAWAVHPRSDSLLKVIDQWINGFRRTDKYSILYNKYFNNRHSYRSIHSEYYTLRSGKISRYDDIIKNESERIGWDWRLLASVIFQESRFNPEAVSWAGAFGLMQLMPITAGSYGITPDSPPEEQIRAGASFIKWLDERFDEVITDPDERIKFVLASYNIGLGHIQDARRLAERYNSDPDRWFGSVDEWLLKKSDPDYYSDPVVRHGFARGIETYNFVKDIMNRYEHYKNIVNEELMEVSQSIEVVRSTSLQ